MSVHSLTGTRLPGLSSFLNGNRLVVENRIYLYLGRSTTLRAIITNETCKLCWNDYQQVVLVTPQNSSFIEEHLSEK